MRWLLGYLGTTLDSWVVATLGFNGYEVVSYPAVCAGGLLILFGKQKPIDISYFLFGFGLLFIGLSFMKTSMEAQVKVLIFICYDVIGRFPHWFYHHRIESSSVTMAPRCASCLGLSVFQLLLP
jgi:phosphate:Na+ symporter